ncbi:hypothetical protein MA5S0921_2612 [Mycobacteroides abscessus 5S-0921]|nr:hypothetical protein MA5S0304_1879 [Mycobacteroides abscessus 5S-0304]EIU12723.1 hypothetical protein MA5S0421_2132 [Mycobacteroides abscessus 5S-0421]EIU22431.1 hypothetical protein MA5S0708_4900 [Mycobacteroides abscessus 5S-0708]EIU24744.1 hypothetical protein MA5S0817_5151 [Mycobacteroides abscessus 5S-0817]EIU43595.1 hypothetical protein MA5S1215_4927 [Mycobacteroides abscessus 5S-1215]EIU92692.1 hypothetical protein MA5S0921_2612 [Mycobacteroides abscessus 5S-0921]
MAAAIAPVVSFWIGLVGLPRRSATPKVDDAQFATVPC